MPSTPDALPALLMSFAPLCSTRMWRHVPVLVVGAILAPGHCMVSTVLRVMGLAPARSFQTYHRVLNRAAGSSRGASRMLFQQLLTAFAPEGPLRVGI
jgi:hypothetical protein